MKTVTHKLFGVFALTAFLLIIIKDFFPDVLFFESLSSRFLIITTIMLTVGLFATKEKEASIFSSKKQELQFQLVFSLLILALIGILTYLGGESKTGIGFDNPVAFVILVFGPVFYYSMLKKELEKTKERS